MLYFCYIVHQDAAKSPALFASLSRKDLASLGGGGGGGDRKENKREERRKKAAGGSGNKGGGGRGSRETKTHKVCGECAYINIV